MAQADSNVAHPRLSLRSSICRPEEVFQAIGRLRKDAGDEIGRLIRFLDKTDDSMFPEFGGLDRRHARRGRRRRAFARLIRPNHRSE
jgi:hypothetical protein